MIIDNFIIVFFLGLNKLSHFIYFLHEFDELVLVWLLHIVKLIEKIICVRLLLEK